MKIQEIEVIPLSYSIDDHPPRVRSFALVKITTDEGVVGWGEASDCYGHTNPLTLKALVDETLRWLVYDQDPLESTGLITRIRERAYAALGHHGLVMQAISAIDIALWDIRGKVLDVSIGQLMGGAVREVELYAAGKPEFRLSGEDYCDEVFTDLIAHGVRNVKIRPGRDLAWDVAFVRQVRDALPSEIGILVDGKYNYRWSSAARLGRVLEEIEALCFEEPLTGANLAGVSRLAAELRVPLAYGEHCFTVHDFRDLITANAIGFAEPDATICGGITEMLRIAAVCDAFGIEVMPHCGGLTAVGLAANLHVAAALPACGLFEFDARAVQPLRDDLALARPFALDHVKDGRLSPPEGPGLGLEIVDEVLDEYPYHVNEEIARSFPIYATEHV